MAPLFIHIIIVHVILSVLLKTSLANHESYSLLPCLYSPIRFLFMQ